jgi:hypothetical protein
MEELIVAAKDKVGPVMDDYDGGQVAAYDKVLEDVNLFRAIINHTSDAPVGRSPEDPMDYLGP